MLKGTSWFQLPGCMQLSNVYNDRECEIRRTVGPKGVFFVGVRQTSIHYRSLWPANRSLLSVFTTRMCKTASAMGLPKSKWVCQKPSLCWTCCLAHQKEFSHSLQWHGTPVKINKSNSEYLFIELWAPYLSLNLTVNRTACSISKMSDTYSYQILMIFYSAS